MSVFLKTRVTEIGPEVEGLAEGGVVILFEDGAPPELAEVSVLHRTEEGPSDDSPSQGASIKVGDVAARITAVGPAAWAKVREIGHVVINFNGATEADRPGEICAEAVDPATLVAALKAGAVIVVEAA
jgi:PTS system glucitol/sorbitol-specific IIA component